ncbi:hypothetical protein DV737_g365, partial [Chaetothyriales sp. CBS 132003]
MSPSSSSSSSSNKIPIPVSLTAATPSLPSESQRALIRHLQETGSLGDLSSILSDSLARSGWTDRVKALAQELLRNGTCVTFPELMTEVMRRASITKGASANNTLGSTGGASQNNGSATPTAQQQNGINGAGSIVVTKEWTGGPDGLPDVRVPNSVVQVGVDFLEETIKDACYRVDDDDDVDLIQYKIQPPYSIRYLRPWSANETKGVSHLSGRRTPEGIVLKNPVDQLQNHLLLHLADILQL